MRWFLILLWAILSTTGFADMYCARTDTSSTNLPTAFSTAGASLYVQNIRNARSVIVDNRTAGEIAVDCSHGATVAPANTSQSVFYVDAGKSWVVDNTFLSGNCYVRSNTGSTISTAIVEVCLVGG